MSPHATFLMVAVDRAATGLGTNTNASVGLACCVVNRVDIMEPEDS